jgi:hypothetical protein
MNKVLSLKEKKTGNVTYVGIVYARNWYGNDLHSAVRLMILPEDFVVGKWSDFHDGQKSNIEGMTTIAICKDLEDAELIFNSK